MRFPFEWALPLLLGACGATQGTHGSPTEFQDLFNGRDLSGWQRVNTAPSTWTVEQGLLRCSGKPTGELRTQRMYQNFVLEVEWRHLVPGGNAGIFVWADDLTARGVPFHRSIEVQVLDHGYGNTNSHTTHGDIFPIHGARMTPVNGRGGSRAFPTALRSKPSPEWNHYRITCNDGSITLAVNGEVVTRGEMCSPSKGYICLESEGGRVDYRNLRIRELPDTPIADRDVAQADRGFESLYSGVDLNGWVLSPQARKLLDVRDWVLRADASKEPVALTTERTFREFDFILDLKLASERATLHLLPHGLGTQGLRLASDEPPLASSLVKGWNRLQGTYRSGHLELEVNGEPCIQSAMTNPQTEGHLFLQFEGGIVDLANLYARQLD